MRRVCLLLLVIVCLFSANLEISAQKRVLNNGSPVKSLNPNNLLPIHRVILYSNGMVYIERRGLLQDADAG